jgi:hypothetical protein
MSNTCNLGESEIRKRKIVGYVGLSSVFLSFVYLYLNPETPLRYAGLIFVPYVITVVGFYQAQQRCCLAIAMAGMQNMDDGMLLIYSKKFRFETPFKQQFKIIRK